LIASGAIHRTGSGVSPDLPDMMYLHVSAGMLKVRRIERATPTTRCRNVRFLGVCGDAREPKV
jgi:hypothetical protein